MLLTAIATKTTNLGEGSAPNKGQNIENFVLLCEKVLSAATEHKAQETAKAAEETKRTTTMNDIFNI